MPKMNWPADFASKHDREGGWDALLRTVQQTPEAKVHRAAGPGSAKEEPPQPFA